MQRLAFFERRCERVTHRLLTDWPAAEDAGAAALPPAVGDCSVDAPSVLLMLNGEGRPDLLLCAGSSLKLD